VVFTWTSAAISGETTASNPGQPVPADYAHINSVVPTSNGDVIASFRNLSAVLAERRRREEARLGSATPSGPTWGPTATPQTAPRAAPPAPPVPAEPATPPAPGPGGFVAPG